MKGEVCTINGKMDFWTWMVRDGDTDDEWNSRTPESIAEIAEENKRYLMRLLRDPNHHFGDCTNHAITCGYCCAEDYLVRYREYFFDGRSDGGRVSIIPDPCIVTRDREPIEHGRTDEC